MIGGELPEESVLAGGGEMERNISPWLEEKSPSYLLRELFRIEVFSLAICDFPGRNASYLANRDMQSTVGEYIVLEGSSTNPHYLPS